MEHYPELSDDSLDIIHTIKSNLEDSLKSQNFEFFTDDDFTPGGLSILLFENNEFFQGLHFSPSRTNGKIHSILINGANLDELFKDIDSSGIIFGFKVNIIQMIEENTDDPSIYILIKDYDFFGGFRPFWMSH